VPGPGIFEIEVLDADPRRVKKVRIHQSKARRTERSREVKRREGFAGLPNAPSTSAEPAQPEGTGDNASSAPVKNARLP
jgi:magnesium and cobalt transporter